jgi:hypothetical protein
MAAPDYDTSAGKGHGRTSINNDDENFWYSQSQEHVQFYR